jgi:signal transduction histidine kinase
MPGSSVERRAIAEEVAASMRHDLRNKFSAVRNAAFYIEKSLEKQGVLRDDPRVARFLSLIDEQLAAADKILDFRMPGASGERESRPTSLASCVEQALARVQHGASRIEWRSGDDASISADSEELVLCFQCLLENALEASADSKVSVSLAVRLEDVSVLFEDTGPGLEPSVRERALEPFATTKPGHAGLGLNVAARVARRHGGELRIDAAPDRQGALVSVVFRRST